VPTKNLSHLLPYFGIVYLAEAPTFERGTIEQNGLDYGVECVRLLRAVELIGRDGEGLNFSEGLLTETVNRFH
jgi:hypothetical protein